MSIFVCFVVLAFLSTSSGIKYKDNDKVKPIKHAKN